MGRAFNDQMRFSKRHGHYQVFLELFAGSSRLSAAFRRRGWGCLGVEVLNGPEFDLLDPKIVRRIEGWISSGCVAGVFFAPPLALHGRTPSKRAKTKSNMGIERCKLPCASRESVTMNGYLASSKTPLRPGSFPPPLSKTLLNLDVAPKPSVISASTAARGGNIRAFLGVTFPLTLVVDLFAVRVVGAFAPPREPSIGNRTTRVAPS